MAAHVHHAHSATASTADPPEFVADLERWFHHNHPQLVAVRPDPDRLRDWISVEVAIVAAHAGVDRHWAYGNGSSLPTARYVADYADVHGSDRSVALYDVPIAPFAPSLADLRWLYEHVSHRLMRLYHTQPTVVALDQPDVTFTVSDRTMVAILPTFLAPELEDLLRDMNLTNFWPVRNELMTMTTVRVPAKT